VAHLVEDLPVLFIFDVPCNPCATLAVRRKLISFVLIETSQACELGREIRTGCSYLATEETLSNAAPRNDAEAMRMCHRSEFPFERTIQQVISRLERNVGTTVETKSPTNQLTGRTQTARGALSPPSTKLSNGVGA